MKIRKTMYLVALFIAVLLFFFSREVEAHERHRDHHVSVSLNAGVINYGGGITQELSYLYDNKWRVAYERFGGDDYNNVNAYRLSREVSWKGRSHGPRMSLGVQYYDSLLGKRDQPTKPIVSERLTFALGLGYAWKISSETRVHFGLLHSSTAGRSERNRGIDRVYLKIDWRL